MKVPSMKKDVDPTKAVQGGFRALNIMRKIKAQTMMTRPLEGLQSKYPVLIRKDQECFLKDSYHKVCSMRPLSLKNIQEACAEADQRLEGFHAKSLEGTSIFITKSRKLTSKEQYANGYKLTLRFEKDAWNIEELEISNAFTDAIRVIHYLAHVLFIKGSSRSPQTLTQKYISPAEVEAQQYFKEKCIPIDAPLPGARKLGMPADMCALSFTASLGLTYWVPFLLEQGANPNEMGPSGKSPLHHCAEASNHPEKVLECAKLLIQAGANPGLISRSRRALPAYLHSGQDQELADFLTQAYTAAKEKKELQKVLDRQTQALSNEKALKDVSSESATGEQGISADETDSKKTKKTRTL